MNRTVEVRSDGIRIVDTNYEEAWHRYVIVPRRLIINAIRDLKRNGLRCSELSGLLPPGFIDEPYYGGPGRDFIRKASVRCNRRFVVFFQSGGLDI